MEVLVVYESMFGNTRKVAEAIASGVMEAAPTATVRLANTGDVAASDISAVSLVVAGGPTHMLGMSRPTSRRQGIDKNHKNAVPVAAGWSVEAPGVREWIDSLRANGAVPVGCLAAAFDTRLNIPLSGSAARHIRRGLRRIGFYVASKPHSFMVEGSYGPLCAGEVERAKSWGRFLASMIPATAAA